MIKTQRPDEVIVCWDGKKNERRLKICPTYKQKRLKLGKDYEEPREQRPKVMSLLFHLGIPQVWDMSMEADDYIYWLVKKYKANPDNQIVIASTDKDFHQLLCRNVTIWDDKVKRKLTRHNLTEHYPYTPKQCVDYLSLFGDKSDEIAGYRGIGEVKAKDFVSKHSIKEFLESDATYKGIDKIKLKKLYKVNREMIDLKYFHNKNLLGKIKIKYLLDKKKPKLNVEKFRAECDKNNLIIFKKSTFIKTFQI